MNKKLFVIPLLMIVVSMSFTAINIDLVNANPAATDTTPDTVSMAAPESIDNPDPVSDLDAFVPESLQQFLANEPVDVAINNTITSKSSRDPSYAERPQTNAPNLDAPENQIIYTNETVITFGSNNNLNFGSNGGGNSIAVYDPSRPPAPLPVTKEGHWFPNMANSRIRYELQFDNLLYSSYGFHVKISRGNDPSTRSFRIYMDGTKIHDQTIGAGGFDSDINLSGWSGTHRVEFEIYSGSYSDNAWKLDEFYAIPNTAEPFYKAHITGEFFPFQAYGQLKWNVYMGIDELVELKIQSVDDPYLRDLKIFVDGTQVIHSYTPGTATFSIGNYAQDSWHEIMVEVSWCNYKEWGYKMSLFRAHYQGLFAEVDYMSGYYPSASALTYAQAYYVDYGYQRLIMSIDESVPLTTNMTVAIYLNNYYNVFFDHRGVNGVTYVLYGAYDDDGNWGWAIPSPTGAIGDKVFIATAAFDDFEAQHGSQGYTRANCEKLVLLHEIGHNLHIIDRDSTGHEVYCDNSYCIMARASYDNIKVSPWYCWHHWDQREFPAYASVTPSPPYYARSATASSTGNGYVNDKDDVLWAPNGFYAYLNSGSYGNKAEITATLSNTPVSGTLHIQCYTPSANGANLKIYVCNSAGVWNPVPVVNTNLYPPNTVINGNCGYVSNIVKVSIVAYHEYSGYPSYIYVDAVWVE